MLSPLKIIPFAPSEPAPNAPTLKPRIGALLAVAAVLFVLPVVLRLFGAALDPYSMSVDRAFTSPGSEFLAGSDAFGRSMGARLLAAAGLTLQAVSSAVGIALALGMIAGGLAGWFHERWPDRLISWLFALVYTVPFYLVAVAIAALIRPGLIGSFCVLGLLAWAVPARLVRAELIQLRRTQCITGLRAAGFSDAFILSRVLLPMTATPAVAALVYFVPELIGAEIGLSFFGLGAQPPTPSLGRELYSGLQYIGSAWWLVWLPATVTLGVVCLFYFIARRLVGTHYTDRLRMNS